MTTYASDTFTRTDTGSGLGTADVGGSYTHRGGLWYISSNKARSSGANSLDTLATGHADGVLEVTIGAAGEGGIAFRVTDASNYWFAMAYSDGNVYIGKYQAGTLSFVASHIATFVPGSILRVVLNGTAIEALVSPTAGGTPASITGMALTGQTFNQTAGDIGPYNWSGTDITLDNLSFVSLSATATKLAVTTQPAGFVSGVAHSTQPVVTVEASDSSTVTSDTSTVTAALVTLSGIGTTMGTLTKAAVAGVADFAGNGLGVTSTGGAFKWRFTDGALTLAESAVFTIGTLTAEQQMVVALGGDPSVLAFYDGRGGVAVTGALVQTWDDYRGSSGYGPQLVAGSASGNKPLYDSTAKTIETNQSGGDTNWLKPAAANSKFDPSAAKELVYIGTMENGQDFVATFQDATQSKYAGLWSGVDGTTGLNTIEGKSSVVGLRYPFAVPSTSRILTRLSLPGAAETAVGNAPVVAQVGGKITSAVRLTSAFASGSWLLVLGGTSSSATTPKYSHAVMRAVLVVDHQLLGAEWDAVVSWAVAQHAAVVDASKKSVDWDGNSISEQIAATTYANSTVGKVASAFPTVDVANHGISGQDGSTILAMQAVRTLPSFHPSRPKSVYVLWGEGTNEIRGGASSTTVINRIIAMAAAARTRGFLVCWGSILPFEALGDAHDTVRVAVNSYFRTNWAVYFDAIADVASIPQMASPASTTYYSDTVHPTDAGHNLCANDATYGFIPALTPLLTVQVAHHLAMVTQPSTGVSSGVPHATQPVVAVKDTSGVTVPSDTSTVTAALVLESGSATPIGTLSKAAVAGVANYSANGLGATSALGATAHWHFTDGALLAVDSATFTIAPAGAPPPPANDFLVIAGITVHVMEGQAVESIEQGGSSQRAQAGNLLSDCPWEKRGWQVTTGLLTRAETATLKAAIAFRAHVPITGLIADASVTCEVSWSNGAYINTSTSDTSGILRSLVLLMREV